MLCFYDNFFLVGLGGGCMLTKNPYADQKSGIGSMLMPDLSFAYKLFLLTVPL